MTQSKFEIKPINKPKSIQVRLDTNIEEVFRVIAKGFGANTTKVRNSLVLQMMQGKDSYELEVGECIVTIPAPLSDVTEESIRATAEEMGGVKSKVARTQETTKKESTSADDQEDSDHAEEDSDKDLDF